jgi:hypothetical protein
LRGDNQIYFTVLRRRREALKGKFCGLRLGSKTATMETPPSLGLDTAMPFAAGANEDF